MPFKENDEQTKEWGSMGGNAKAAIYELDRLQLEKMRKVLDKDLEIIERLQNAEEINPIDERKLAISQARVSKYLDKLHASRESKELSGEVILHPILVKFIDGKESTNSNNDTK